MLLTILGLVIPGVLYSAAALEITTALKQINPDQTEFVVAAKKALFRRNYEISVKGPNRIVGEYKRGLIMEIILTDTAVTVRNTDPGRNYKTDTVKKYLRNLHRDMVYEFAKYLL